MVDNPLDEKKFEQVFSKRKQEADSFYKAVQPENITKDEALVQRQALAGLLWSKQFYHYSKTS